MTITCKTYDEFCGFYNKYIKDAERVALDYETNAEECYSVNHEIVGFSLASNSEVGCYVPIRALDFEMKSEDREKIYGVLKDVILNKRILVYNCLHELAVTANHFCIDIPFERLDDLFVLVKMMMSNADGYKGRGGLKLQASECLGVEDWSADLDRYFEYLRNYNADEIPMFTLLRRYYSEGEVKSLSSKILYVANEVLPKEKEVKCLSYGYVPCNIIDKYGAADVCVLFELEQYYNELIKKTNEELNINLYEGYRVWMKHHYCGYLLEKNGAFWGEQKASELEYWCNETKKKCLYNLIISPLSSAWLRESLMNDYLDYIRDTFVDEVFKGDYIPKKRTKNTIEVIASSNSSANRLESMKVEKVVSKKGIVSYKLNRDNFRILAEPFMKENRELFEYWYANTIKDKVGNGEDVKKMLSFINPNSTNKEFVEFVSKLLVSQEVREAMLYLDFAAIVENPTYNIDFYKDFYEGGKLVNYRKFKIYPTPTMEWFRENYPNMTYVDNEDSRILSSVERIEAIEGWSRGRRFNLFKKIDFGKPLTDKKLKAIVSSAMEYGLPGLDASNINRVYEAYVMLNVNVEDKDTWSKEFEWLFNLKLYKKMEKLTSTYVNGKIGRSSVRFVDKEAFSRGDSFVPRYTSEEKDLYATHGELTTVMQTSFGVNMARTGRWTSGFHNIPAGECVKSIYTSRFKGGCIAMPDGSQMEIRALAAECKDENLFKAFKDDLDIHRYFASKIYKVPYDEVTSLQRSTAKGAVFGLIYGMSERSFAERFTHGNVQEARNIFNAMYEGFPKIKEYVERAHKEFSDFGRVTTLTNRFITPEAKKGKTALLRESQNYKIQGYAADLAGLIMFEIADYIIKHNMKSKLICMIHDSIEIDIHPDELFELVDVINKAFNEYPLREFGVPVACDVPLSVNMGAECKILSFEHDDIYNDVTIELKGYIKDIKDLFNVWKNDAYDFVEWVDEENYKANDVEEYQPWSNMLSSGKSTITQHVGETLAKGSRKIHVIRKK